MTTFKVRSIFEAAVAVAKTGLSLKPNHHSQVKLVQIPDTHCMNDGLFLGSDGTFLVAKQ